MRSGERLGAGGICLRPRSRYLRVNFCIAGCQRTAEFKSVRKSAVFSWLMHDGHGNKNGFVRSSQISEKIRTADDDRPWSFAHQTAGSEQMHGFLAS